MQGQEGICTGLDDFWDTETECDCVGSSGHWLLFPIGLLFFQWFNECHSRSVWQKFQQIPHTVRSHMHIQYTYSTHKIIIYLCIYFFLPRSWAPIPTALRWKNPFSTYEWKNSGYPLQDNISQSKCYFGNSEYFLFFWTILFIEYSSIKTNKQMQCFRSFGGEGGDKKIQWAFLSAWRNMLGLCLDVFCEIMNQLHFAINHTQNNLVFFLTAFSWLVNIAAVYYNDVITISFWRNYRTISIFQVHIL